MPRKKTKSAVKALTHHLRRRKPTVQKTTINDLLNAESALGRTLFGPIPEGHRREFFHHEKNIWIWHESWQESGKTLELTVRYEVRPHGVFKRPLNGLYQEVKGEELKNFHKAAKSYLTLLKTHIYT
jgi:hypothetical protein